VQYYTRQRVDPAAPGGFAPAPEGAPLTQMGWELHPEGLHASIMDAASTGLPVVVTENGIATDDDAERITYLHDHLAQVKRAMDDGADVLGYLCWSAFDNFEWNHGFAPRFGLVGIERDDGLKRVVRPSARAFGAVAASGRLADLAPCNSGNETSTTR
jgi:beta-glucosidase